MIIKGFKKDMDSLVFYQKILQAKTFQPQNFAVQNKEVKIFAVQNFHYNFVAKNMHDFDG